MTGQAPNSAQNDFVVVAPSGRDGESAILTSALKVLGDKGFNGMSMRDVASSAGTSLSNLYNYFSSKADLVATLLTITNNDLLSRLRAALSKCGGSPTEQLTAAIDAYVSFNVERTTASLVGISEIRYLDGDRRQAVVAARDETEAIFRQIITAGSDSGEFNTRYPREAALGLVTMLSGISLWYRADGPLDRNELADRQIRFGLAIVEARTRLS